MRGIFICLAIASVSALSAPALGQTRADEQRWQQAQRRFDAERVRYEREREIYMSSRQQQSYYNDGYDDRYVTDYDASRYYSDDPRYRERVLSAQDQVYRGSDGRYYCRRSDGTTGLVLGAGAGALLGRAIDGGRSRAGGTIVGGVLGALLGRTVEQQRSEIRCR
jgi:hypothetical protein